LELLEIKVSVHIENLKYTTTANKSFYKAGIKNYMKNMQLYCIYTFYTKVVSLT